MPRTQKRVIVWLIVLLIFTGFIFIGYGYLMSYQKLQVDFAQDAPATKASIYRIPTDDDTNTEAFINNNYVVEEVSQNETIKLKKGRYVLVARAGHDYQEQILEFRLGDKLEILTIRPLYSSNKLKSLLNEQKATIHGVITTSFSKIINGYNIDTGKLYEHGEWYGTTLKPKLSREESRLSYTDVYRLVAQKENGSWKIVTLPPELILSSVKYPNIPIDILKDINSL